VTLDVTSTTAIKAATQVGLSKLSRVEVVVNNAGYGFYGDTENAADEQARKLLDTNF
jgi:NADP-dependent 3-hydroxy acid dehydrogenase YdfG